MVLVSSGRVRGLTVITVMEAALNFVLSVALVKRYEIWGVALGTVIPMILVRGVVFPLLLNKELGITPLEYAKMHGRPVLLGALYLLLVSWLAWIPLTSYARFIGLAVVSTLVFGGLVLVTVPEARAAAPKVLARFTRRRRAA
jgi:hypothetical protein